MTWKTGNQQQTFSRMIPKWCEVEFSACQSRNLFDSDPEKTSHSTGVQTLWEGKHDQNQNGQSSVFVIFFGVKIFSRFKIVKGSFLFQKTADRVFFFNSPKSIFVIHIMFLKNHVQSEINGCQKHRLTFFQIFFSFPFTKLLWLWWFSECSK